MIGIDNMLSKLYYKIFTSKERYYLDIASHILKRKWRYYLWSFKCRQWL